MKNRTEGVISVLRDTHHMKIHNFKNGIFCDDGRLMNYPVQVYILPQFGLACFHVYLYKECNIGNDVIKIDIQYINDVPIELLINEVVRYFNSLIKKRKWTT